MRNGVALLARLLAKKPASRIAGLACLVTAVSSGPARDWILTNAPTNDWSSIASSADGGKLVATDSGAGDGLIYTSSDGGTNWGPTSAPASYWSSVASSADGSTLVAA